MKLIIDIPKKTYNEIVNSYTIHCGETFAQKMVGYVKAGTPLEQKPKTGHWIDREIYDADRWKCSECGHTEQWRENYCSNCGAKMSEIPTGSENPNKSEPKTDTLDKIKTEIEQVKAIMNEEIIEHDRRDLINFINGINQCLVIIDQYRE